MALFTRRREAPAPVLARVGLGRGDAVLAAVPSGDTWLIGSRAALTLVPAAGEAVLRIPWEHVEQASWDSEESVLSVSEVGEWGRVRPVHRFVLADPDRLLQLVRERVTTSLVLQRRVAVSGRRGLVVVARRPPLGGEIGWYVEYDEGVDPADPVVRDLVEVALAGARSDLGVD